MNKDECNKILDNYAKTCKYLKQINSNKARKFSNYNNCLTIITLLITVVLSAIAFINKDIFVKYFSPDKQENEKIKEIIELGFNGLTLIVLILTLINLLYRFQEKSSTYFHSVITLSSLIREINNFKQLKDKNKSNYLAKFQIIETKYNVTLDYLPQHTDKDFLKAKYDLKVKDILSEKIKKDEIPDWKVQILLLKKKLFLHNKKGE
ncbi:hypothetical protein [Sphingobacterium anhuiense]|uniref:hypothetical protein n=1 Tax=Sphingobacterium anhuiense TaxID=493780 RepID=UPI003C2EE9B4